MRAVDKIRRSIKLSKYRIFFTRDDLARFGDRSTITRSLHVLVTTGELTKLYPGAYVRTDEFQKNYRLQYLAKNPPKSVRTSANILDKALNSALASKVREMMSASKVGTIFDVKDFSMLAHRRKIKSLLDAFVEAGEMFCPSEGLYCSWVFSRFGKSAPAIEDFIQGYMNKTGETVVEDGCCSANAFHFTTQFPGCIRFLTSGQHRTLINGKEKVYLTHGENWMLFEPYSKCGRMVRAINFMNKGSWNPDIDRIRFELTQAELKHLFDECDQFPIHIKTVINEAYNG